VTARRLAIAAALVGFVAISVVVARWLQADGTERAGVERLLAAQVRGDADAMAREIGRCDATCARGLERLAVRLRRPGDLEIVRYDSRTARALGAERAPTRVVWQVPPGLPTVQCIDVRRTGSAVTGPRVTLLGLSAPIGRESPC
jgi:uncharacterized membrane protein